MLSGFLIRRSCRLDDENFRASYRVTFNFDNMKQIKKIFGAWSPIAICKLQAKRASFDHVGLTVNLLLLPAKKTKYTGMLSLHNNKFTNCVFCLRYQRKVKRVSSATDTCVLRMVMLFVKNSRWEKQYRCTPPRCTLIFVHRC